MPFTEFTDYLRLEKNYSEHTVAAYSKDLVDFQNEFFTIDPEAEIQARQQLILDAQQGPDLGTSVLANLAAAPAFRFDVLGNEFLVPVPDEPFSYFEGRISAQIDYPDQPYNQK